MCVADSAVPAGITWCPVWDNDGSTLISYLSRAIYFRHEPTLPAVISAVLVGIVDNPVKSARFFLFPKAEESSRLQLFLCWTSSCSASPSIFSSMGSEDPFVPWSHDTGASPRKEAVICSGLDYNVNPLQRASTPLQIHTSCTNHYRLKWIQPSARHSQVMKP